MTISPETIDKVRLSIDIVELVREYVPVLKKAGRNWKALCPFHSEKTPSFMVSPDKGIFHCFGCHTGGDVFKFIMQADNLSWPEAVKKLADRAGIAVAETKDDANLAGLRSKKQKIYDLLESARDFYNRNLAESKEASKAREYLKSRNVSDDSVKKFKIGYAPAGALLGAALKKGFTREELIEAGLIIKTERGAFYEYMSQRLVFPIVDIQGRVVAFGGRTLKDEQPKYLNTPETAVYSKSSQLYGLFQSIPLLRQNRTAIVLEGYMDVVMTHQYGLSNTVATLGTSLTLQHAQLLSRYAENVVLLFDPDAAGNAAAWRAIEIFIDREMPLNIVNLPDGLDPDEFIIAEGKDKFLEYISQKGKSIIEFLVFQALAEAGRLTPETKTKVVSRIIPVISKVKNAVLLHEWVKYLSESVKVSEEGVYSELKRAGRNARNNPSDDKTVSTANAIRTCEEELLQLLLNYPQYVGKVNAGMFLNERNQKVYSLIKDKTPVADIINHIEEADVSWVTELILEEKNYSSPEQMLSDLTRDVEQTILENERLSLEKEVVLMLNGKIPADSAKIRLYQDLNKQLKGSEK